MTRFHIILFCLAVFSLPTAQAEESPYKGGMNYTTVGAGKNAPAKNTALGNSSSGHLKLKSFSSAEPEPEEEPAATKVWKKYKALAAGQPEPEEDIQAEAAEPAAEKAAEPAPAPVTGFAAILNKYQTNKSQQKQLHSIEVPRPRAPAKPRVNGTNN